MCTFPFIYMQNHVSNIATILILYVETLKFRQVRLVIKLVHIVVLLKIPRTTLAHNDKALQ